MKKQVNDKFMCYKSILTEVMLYKLIQSCKSNCNYINIRLCSCGSHSTNVYNNIYFVEYNHHFKLLDIFICYNIIVIKDNSIHLYIYKSVHMDTDCRMYTYKEYSFLGYSIYLTIQDHVKNRNR